MREKAIYKIYPNVKSTIGNDAYDANGNPVVLDENKIKAQQDLLEKEFLDNQYQRSRAAEYPSITDVVVALAEKEEGDSTMWDDITAKRQAVKTKYKKG